MHKRLGTCQREWMNTLSLGSEARRNAPSLVYLPNLHLWAQPRYGPQRAALIMALRGMPATLPVRAARDSGLWIFLMDLFDTGAGAGDG
jgi:hypothetical protein